MTQVMTESELSTALFSRQVFKRHDSRYDLEVSFTIHSLTRDNHRDMWIARCNIEECVGDPLLVGTALEMGVQIRLTSIS